MKLIVASCKVCGHLPKFGRTGKRGKGPWVIFCEGVDHYIEVTGKTRFPALQLWRAMFGPDPKPTALQCSCRGVDREDGLHEPSCSSLRPRCEGCGAEIDPDCCGCGDSREGHVSDTHGFVPMGCNCNRADSQMQREKS